MKCSTESEKPQCWCTGTHALEAAMRYEGYQQALLAVLDMLSEAERHVSEALEVEEYRARMETFSHIRSMVRGVLK
jgi:hypothetical protein